jgi:Delta3,5-Delta2,4-dienoyl-CoA isomerase
MDRNELLTSDVISVEFDGHVATVWLDRAEARNAFAPDFWTDFPAIIDALGEDTETRVIVIAGKGSAFTAGIDLKAFGPSFVSGGVAPSGQPGGSGAAQRMENYRTIKRMQRTFSSLAECPKPVIAAIHGYCLGAGVDLITACDIRYAASDAVFSVRETRIAMVADVGTLQRLPRIVDPGRVAEIVYTGKDFDADEALEMGLISRIAPNAETVQKLAADTAAAIAANSPLAVQGAKAVLRAGETMSVDEHLDYVALWNSSFIHSSDLAEATMAFLEKRSPEFTGE